MTGIIDDLPKNSFLKDRSVFMAMSGYEDAQENEWTSHNYFTFVKLIEGTDIDDFQVLLQSMVRQVHYTLCASLLSGDHRRAVCSIW